MLVTELYSYGGGAIANHELLEVHRSKISLHRAKADYSYPTIRLPYTFSKTCRTVDAYLSNGSQWGACVSCCCLVDFKKQSR